MRIITDINGTQADNEIGIYVTRPNKGVNMDIKPEPVKFIGPALQGGTSYFSLRRPRSSKEFKAINLRAFRN
jgi:hypothetical protein